MFSYETSEQKCQFSPHISAKKEPLHTLIQKQANHSTYVNHCDPGLENQIAQIDLFMGWALQTTCTHTILDRDEKSALRSAVEGKSTQEIQFYCNVGDEIEMSQELKSSAVNGTIGLLRIWLNSLVTEDNLWVKIDGTLLNHNVVESSSNGAYSTIVSNLNTVSTLQWGLKIHENNTNVTLGGVQLLASTPVNLGCFKVGNSLPTDEITLGMTHDYCMGVCNSAGMKISALKSGNSCHCLPNLDEVSKVEESLCDISCNGNKMENCGSNNDFVTILVYDCDEGFSRFGLNCYQEQGSERNFEDNIDICKKHVSLKNH